MTNDGTPVYVAGAGDNQVISAKPCILKKVIFAKDVASSVVEVSNHPSDGDGNLIAKFEGSTLMTANGGDVDLNAVCDKGLCIDSTNQTNMTFVIVPLGSQS